MFKKLDMETFVDEFDGKHFSAEALEVLFTYLEEENPDYVLDVKRLMGEWTEGHLYDVLKAYGMSRPLDLYADTTVIHVDVDDGILYRDF